MIASKGIRAETRRPKFNFRRYLILTSAVALISASVLLGVLYRQNAVTELIELSESQNVELAQVLANAVSPSFYADPRPAADSDGNAVPTRPESDRIKGVLTRLTADTSVLKVRIHNIDGLTVYSSDPGEIGLDLGGTPEFMEAKQAGQPRSQLTFMASFRSFGGTVTDRNIVDTYIPIRGADGTTDAVFEFYSDITPLVHKIEQTTAQLVASLMLIFGFWCGVLYLIARRADSLLKKQYSDLQHSREEVEAKNMALASEVVERVAAERALREAHGLLEQHVQERTRELQSVNTALAEEVAEHKRTEDALQSSEEQFRKLIEGSIQGILIHRDGKPLFANQALADMFAYDSPEEVIALGSVPQIEAAHERDRLDAYGTSRQQGLSSPKRYEFEGLRKDGSPIWLENFVTIVDWQGEPAVQSTMINVTKRKWAEEALRQSEERLYDAIESISEGFIFYDADERLVLCNKKYREFFPKIADLMVPGVRLEDVLRASAELGQVLQHPENVDAWSQQRLEQYRTGRGRNEQQLSDGRWVQATERRTREGGIVGIRTDITERKLAEAAMRAATEEAEIANRAKSEFLANMSHELRTPLNAIIGFAQMIESEIVGPIEKIEYRDYAKDISSAGQYLLKLISDILDLSKIEAGKVDIDEGPVDVLETIRSSLVLVSERAQAGEVTLEQDTPDELPALHADERMLKQILVNLLSNAVKFTPANGRVTVRAWVRPKDGYVIQIADTGIGMALEDIPKAMSRFAQVESQLRRRHEGTGLGLPLSKSFVELHGGSLGLQSERGVGTTVTVRLPAERIIQKKNKPKPEHKTEAAKRSA